METAPEAPGRGERPCVVLALEGVLLDPRPAIDAVVARMSGGTPDDIRRFRELGEYADPWELARALNVWVRGGRHLPVPAGGWRAVVNLHGDDPGDLATRCAALHRTELWRRELPLLDAARLRRLAEVADIAVCTSRDREGLANAEELLGFRFERSTTSEDASIPDPAALTRLAARGHFLGHSEDDRRCAVAARFLWHAAERDPARIVDLLVERLGARV